eukprot:Skav209678  [mRNA]  locus=scaffold1603:79995:83237:- [translate_table: standard]
MGGGKGAQKGRAWQSHPQKGAGFSLSTQRVPPEVWPTLSDIFIHPHPDSVVNYPRWTEEPEVSCPKGHTVKLSRLPFQAGCRWCVGINGWPQWVLREFYFRVLSEQNLPWAELTTQSFEDSQYGVNYYRKGLSKGTKGLPPMPGGKGFQKGPENKGLPGQPHAPENKFVVDPGMEAENLVHELRAKAMDLSAAQLQDKLSELLRWQSNYHGAQAAAQRTYERLKTDISAMENHMEMLRATEVEITELVTEIEAENAKKAQAEAQKKAEADAEKKEEAKDLLIAQLRDSGFSIGELSALVQKSQQPGSQAAASSDNPPQQPPGLPQQPGPPQQPPQAKAKLKWFAITLLKSAAKGQNISALKKAIDEAREAEVAAGDLQAAEETLTALMQEEEIRRPLEATGGCVGNLLADGKSSTLGVTQLMGS